MSDLGCFCGCRLDPTGKMLDVIVPTSEQPKRNTTPSPCNTDKTVSKLLVLDDVELL